MPEVLNDTEDAIGYTYKEGEEKIKNLTFKFETTLRDLLDDQGAEVLEKLNLDSMTPGITRESLFTFAQQFTAKAIKIAEAKNNDYSKGVDPFRNFRLAGAYGIAVRLSDKISRTLSLLEPGASTNVKDESLEDTCIDMCNYSWLLAAYLQEK